MEGNNVMYNKRCVHIAVIVIVNDAKLFDFNVNLFLVKQCSPPLITIQRDICAVAAEQNNPFIKCCTIKSNVYMC